MGETKRKCPHCGEVAIYRSKDGKDRFGTKTVYLQKGDMVGICRKCEAVLVFDFVDVDQGELDKSLPKLIIPKS